MGKADKVNAFREFLSFLKSELKPRGPIFTPFNVISAPVIFIGIVLIIYRFAVGLGPTTNLTQEFPWGLWIGFDVIVGIAFAGGGYTLAFIVYVLGVEKYRPIFRATVLSAFLAYVFYAGAIIIDLGRWWNLANPFIGREFGVSSVMFIVACLSLLCMLTLGLEFSPTVAEWLGMKRLRKILDSLTLGAVIFGVMLSINHQSGAGALFAMAKGKIHPLWYTEFIPVLFFISSIFAGLSLVIFEGTISHKVFAHQIDEKHHKAYPDIVIGLAKISAGVMFAYFALNAMLVLHEAELQLITTPMGYWYLTEVIGFVLVPCFMFVYGVQHRNLSTICTASVLTLIGIILNRFNYVFIAYNWYLPLEEKYYPHWIEVWVTLTIVFITIWVFRWVVNRMPVLRESPEWAIEKH